jgi:hypothetical protein
MLRAGDYRPIRPVLRASLMRDRLRTAWRSFVPHPFGVRVFFGEGTNSGRDEWELQA